MKPTVTKVIGTAAGVTLLAPGIALAVPPEAPDAGVPDVAWTQVEASSQTVESTVSVPRVQGEFSYNQTTLTPNSRIAQVFQKAANALCQASCEMTVTAPEDWAISVSGDVENAYTATLGQLAAEDEQTTIMGCACAGNTAGGAAVINAEVTGVPMATIIERAQPKAGVNTVTLVSEDGYRMSLPLDYVMARRALVVSEINGEGLSSSVGGTNQLWIDAAAAKYFTRNVVAIELTAQEVAPDTPGTEDAPDDQYVNRPNAGITKAASMQAGRSPFLGSCRLCCRLARRGCGPKLC